MIYFTYVRGRLFEKKKKKKAIEMNMVGNNIIPIIEPIQLNTTLLRTLKEYEDRQHPVIVIRNPQVGNFFNDIRFNRNNEVFQLYIKFIESSRYIYNGIILNKTNINIVNQVLGEGKPVVTIFSGNRDDLVLYDLIARKHVQYLYHLGPDTRWFDRIVREHKVIFQDHFHVMGKNADYLKNEDEFFSCDHLDYEKL